MKQTLKHFVGLVLTLLAVLPMQAQEENAAFYIYQNDGLFDGFFYDEVQKISYSFLDTLGIEHDEVVSQEIVTADSTYRIMLSAIDSVGFVQPEVIYNPNLRIVHKGNNGWFIDNHSCSLYYNTNTNLISYSIADTPSEYLPHVGDVFYYPDPDGGWCVKTVSVTENEGYMQAKFEPYEFEDIPEIFQQFVSVEEYGYDDAGNLARRRVAGRPELNVGRLPRKASGTWEGDLFNFSLSGHIPLYDNNDLTITIDPIIQGKLHLKTTWNLSLFGDKYIGIHSKLNFGVGSGFSVDGKISDLFPGGVGGLLGGVPVPATCPLIYIDIAPDAFLRGEAHVKFNMSTPMLNGAIWSKLEINNWIPSMSMGFRNSDDGSEFESVDNNSAGVTMSLNGYIQGGMLFPLKFKSLPLIKKFFNAEIGGQWYVGPKVSADFTLDLTTSPWNDVATYNQLKNITLGLHLLDADFEVKGTVQTAFSGKKEMTLADGSFSLLPPLDTKLVPEFGDCVEYVEDRTYEGEMTKCRVYAFEPKGDVIKPVKIGTYLCRINDDGTERLLIGNPQSKSYDNYLRNFGQEYPKRYWAEYVIPITPGEVDISYRGAYKLRPSVCVVGSDYLVASNEYDFQYGICEATPNADTIFVNCEGIVQQPVTIKGTCENLRSLEMFTAFDDVFQVTGSKGNLVVTLKNPENPNYNPREKATPTTVRYRGETTTEYGEIFYSDDHLLTVCYLPNTCKEPIGGGADIPDSYLLKWTFSRIGNDGWHCVGAYKEGGYNYNISFDLVADDNWKNDEWVGGNVMNYPNYRCHMKFHNMSIDATQTENGEKLVDIHETYTDVPVNTGTDDNRFYFIGPRKIRVCFPKP